MSNNLKKYSFIDLLKQGKLRIPKIQRDYAQGRQSQKVDEIRKVFCTHSSSGGKGQTTSNRTRLCVWKQPE